MCVCVCKLCHACADAFVLELQEWSSVRRILSTCEKTPRKQAKSFVPQFVQNKDLFLEYVFTLCPGRALVVCLYALAEKHGFCIVWLVRVVVYRLNS